MKLRNEEDLKARWLADAEGKVTDPEAHAGELTAGGWVRRARAWLSDGLDVWTARFEKIGKWLKSIAMVLGGAAAIVALIKQLRTRNVAPAELPRGTGERTFMDRVDKPKAP